MVSTIRAKKTRLWDAPMVQPKVRTQVLSDSVQCPYGYRVRDGKMEIVEEEAYVVKKVLSLYNDGNGMSSKQIVEILDQEGYRTRNGCQLQSTIVLKIWQNKDLYKGKRQNKYGYYPPII